MSWEGPERRKTPVSCQAEILEKIHELQLQKEQERLEQHQMHEENTKAISRILTFVFGNSDQSQGAVVRLDRIEQTLKLMTYAMGTTGVVVIGIVVKSMAESMLRH